MGGPEIPGSLKGTPSNSKNSCVHKRSGNRKRTFEGESTNKIRRYGLLPRSAGQWRKKPEKKPNTSSHQARRKTGGVVGARGVAGEQFLKIGELENKRGSKNGKGAQETVGENMEGT